MSFASVITFGQGHYLGFNGGYTYSSANILNSTVGEIEPQHLYFGEFNYQYHAEKWFYFNVGLRYDRKGFGINNEPMLETIDDTEFRNDTLGNYTHDFHKVGVPVKLGFKLGKKVYFHLAAGLIPSYSFMSVSDYDLSYQGNPIESGSTENWTNIKNFELAWLGEIGIGAQLGENVLFTIIGGYSQSLTKHLLPFQSAENNTHLQEYRTIRFKGIHAAIGVHFKLHKPKQKMQKFSSSTN